MNESATISNNNNNDDDDNNNNDSLLSNGTGTNLKVGVGARVNFFLSCPSAFWLYWCK